jgi:PHD/YefM family antitoxin component YafN of YafNO toxin-antitoxin module
MFGRTLNEMKDYTNVTDSNPSPTYISLDDWQEHQEKILSLIFPAISERVRGAKDKLIRH